MITQSISSIIIHNLSLIIYNYNSDGYIKIYNSRKRG